jgi:hypothetical protein
VCAGGIYLLNKTASNFKVETLGQMAESVAWKLYLQQQKSDAKVLAQKVDAEVKRVMLTV